MKKIKKLLGSLGIFLVSIKSKVFAAGYEIPDQFVEVKYGTFEPTIAEKFSVITNFVLPLILLYIGFGVILSKKIKIIIVVVLILIGILANILIKYL